MGGVKVEVGGVVDLKKAEVMREWVWKPMGREVSRKMIESLEKAEVNWRER